MIEKVTIKIVGTQTDHGLQMNIEVDPVHMFTDDVLSLMRRAVTHYERMSIVNEFINMMGQAQENARIMQVVKGKLS